MTKADVKFYSETIGASLLSVMAVVVSCSQCGIASKQTALLDAQTQIAKQQMMPILEIYSSQRKTTNPNSFDEDVLYIKNVGHPVRDFGARNVSLVNIVFDDPSRNIHKDSSFIMSGYYLASVSTASGTGVLAYLIGENNNARFGNLNREYLRHCENKGCYGYIELCTYLKIGYTDRLGKRHLEYYKVERGQIGTMVTPDEGKKVFDRLDSDVTKCIDLEQLTKKPKILFSVIGTS